MTDNTGKTQDECVTALHDCNGDVDRVISVLLEGNTDTHSWEGVRKKKGDRIEDGGRWNPIKKAKKVENGTKIRVNNVVGH